MIESHNRNTGFPTTWSAIWRWKRMLMLIVAMSAVAAMTVSLLLPSFYKSETVILAVAPETGGLGAALSVSPLGGSLTGALAGLSSPADRIMVLLKSRTIAEMVVKRFDLIRVFNERAWDASKGAWKNPGNPPLMEDAVKRLSKKVVSFRKSREGAITITVEWKDPKLAAAMANYYVVALVEFMKDKSINTTIQIVDQAVPAGKKSSPKPVVNTVVGGIVGLFFGIVAAVFRGRLSEIKHKSAQPGE